MGRIIGLLLVYSNHLRMVKADMEIHIRDLLNLDVLAWVVQPFQADVTKCKTGIQQHLVNIQCDEEVWAIFHTSGRCNKWVKYAQLYPALAKKLGCWISHFQQHISLSRDSATSSTCSLSTVPQLLGPACLRCTTTKTDLPSTRSEEIGRKSPRAHTNIQSSLGYFLHSK